MRTEILRPDAVLAADGLHDDWVVEVADGIIVGLGPAARYLKDNDAPIERLAGRVLMPGLVDAHSHAFQRAIRGHAQQFSGAGDFWTWRDAMYRTANALTPEGVEAVSALAFLELAEAGVTAVGEFHYLHHQPDGTPYEDPDELARRVIAAATGVGIRIVLLRVLYGRNGPDAPLRPEQRRMGDAGPDDALAAVARLEGAHPLATVGLAPHSVRAVPRGWMSALADFDGPVHAHVSEQPAEVRGCLAEHGRSPLAVFAEAGLVTERFTAVHLTWPEPGDLDLLADAGGTACLCPTTELDLGDGIFPLADFRGDVAVGSDSHATSDLLLEARLVDGLGRAAANRRVVGQGTPTDRILSIATSGGARALGLEGGVAVGRPADLVAVDVTAPRFAGVPLPEALAFAAEARDVADVWVAGRRVVSGGRHPRRDAVVRRALPYL